MVKVATIEEQIESTTRLLREQIEESPIMAADTMDARGYRYAFAMGSLLAFVPDEVKAELMALIRNGGAKDPLAFDFGPDSTNLPIDDRPAGMLGGPFTAPEDPEYRYGA